MDVERVFGKLKLLRALTSLEAGEFARLLTAFEQEGQARRGQFNRFSEQRRRAPGATGNPGVLATPKARLCFVLFYFKCYPLQEIMGVLFGPSQPQACLWIGRPTSLINAALGRELVLSARRPADLDKLLAEVPELRLLIMDGVERPIRRPKDKQSKKDDYSGKKKAHRKKNRLVSSHERSVAYLGPTSPGSLHNKKLAEENGLRFPADALVLKDTGLQGHEPLGCATLQPRKRPRGRALPAYSLAINKVISRVRVQIEHTISGVKRCRITADTFRSWRAGTVDAVILATSGLHNLRVAARA